MISASPAIGVILPSSNRVVERVTHSILAGFPDVDACFTRVPYSGHPPDGYALEPFRRAAMMLAEARPEIIVWNATRGALLGFEPDRQLCAELEDATGIRVTTTALATVDLLRARKLTRIGLLAQGDEREGTRLVETFGREGIEIIASANLGIRDNYEAARVPVATIETEAGLLAMRSDPDAIVIWSTNLAGYRAAEHLSLSRSVPVFDSTAIGTFQALSYIGTGRGVSFPGSDLPRIISSRMD